MNILLIEDEPKVARAIRQGLEAEGYHVAAAATGEEGYFLASRVLAPVKAITHKAREIRADRLSERLPVANPGDEVGQLAGAFNETLSRLEESFERLRRFTADACHELRTPLTSMRSVGELALQGPPDSTSCQEAIGSMLEEIQRVAQLVDNLLTLARGDSGKVRLTPSVFMTRRIREPGAGSSCPAHDHRFMSYSAAESWRIARHGTRESSS